MNDKIRTILQALIDGKDIEFLGPRDWCKASVGATLTVLANWWEYGNDTTKLRIKPKTIQIGEFTVPEPLRTVPTGVCWLIDPTSTPYIYSTEWQNTQCEREWLANGMIQATKEGAEQQLAAIFSLTKEKK